MGSPFAQVGTVTRAEGLGAQAEPLRLLYVIDSLGHGGAEQSLVEMLPEYRERGVSTIIITLVARDTELVRRAEAAGARVVQAPAGAMATQAIWLRSAIDSLRPHVVHTTLFRADLVGRAAAAGTSVPVLTSLVNTQYAPERRRESAIPGWKLRVAQELERWSGRFWTDHFHVNSEAVRVSAVEQLGIPDGLMTVIPRGRNPDRFAPVTEAARRRTRTELGLRSDVQLVLNVGRQEPQKAQRYLVEAFDQVVARRPQSRLAIVGANGSASAGLRQRIEELELGQHVMLLGRRDDVPELLGAADVFVLPSLWEGLPNVVIEAMATGLPVVASDIPPVREAVDPDRSAILATPSDPHSLAEALLRVLADPYLSAELGQRGREVFLERFTIGPVADQMVQLYRQLAKRQR